MLCSPCLSQVVHFHPSMKANMNRFRELLCKTNAVIASPDEIIFRSGHSQYSFPESPKSVVQDAIGYLQGVQMCAFERMDWRNNLLHICHFAVMEQFIGMGLGEQSLRTFARLVSKQLPGVDEIQFELSQSSDRCSVEALSKARRTLLEKIGAVDIHHYDTRKDCRVVACTWQKSQWTKIL